MLERDGGFGPGSFIRLTDRRGAAWRVRSGFEARLFDGGEFLPESRVLSQEVIKRTVSRSVLAVDLKGPEPVPLIVKTYLARPGLDDLLRGVLYPSSAEIERRHAIELLRRGIEVAAPVASGQRPAGILSCESILVSERYTGAVDLWAALRDGRVSHSGRLSVIEALADLFRRLHGSGVLHQDPHLQNLLLVGGFEAPRLIPIDLRRIRIEGNPSERSRKENLALLVHAASSVASRSDRRRFFDAYLGAAVPAGARRSFQAEVEARAARLARRLAPVRARKALRGNRRFERRREGGMLWHIRSSEAGGDLLDLLQDPEKAFRDPARLLKSGRSSTVALCGRFVVKRFNLKRRRNLLLDRFRLSRPRRNFARALLLESLRIPTAKAIAAAERRVHGLVAGGYLVSLAIPGAKDCIELLRSGGLEPAQLRLSGRLIARLHEARLAHRDLKAPNILLDSRGLPHLIDLDGLRMARRVGPRRAASDLARFVRDLVREAGDSFSIAEPVLEGYCGARPGVDPRDLVSRVRRGLGGDLGTSRRTRRG